MRRRTWKSPRVLAGLGLLFGSLTVAGLGVSATALTGSSALVSSSTPVYTPVAFNLSALISARLLSPAVHLEQTVQAANGNYYVDTDGGNGDTNANANEIIEVSGTAPHGVIGVVTLPSALDGQPLGDGVAIGDTLYYRNVTGTNPTGGSGACPVIAIDLNNLGSPTSSTTTPSFSTWALTSSNGLSCAPAPAGSSYTLGSGPYAITSVGSTVYWTGNRSIYAWDTSTSSVTRYPLGVGVNGGLAVYLHDGSTYAFVGSGGGASIDMFDLSTLASTGTAPKPVYTWSLPPGSGTGSNVLGDFQVSQGQGTLWFVREFQTQIGDVQLSDAFSSSTPSTPGQGNVYNIGNVPNQASQAESMTLDPSTGNLWVASGNVNGSYSPGGEVYFGWLNPTSLHVTQASTQTAAGDITLNYESTPSGLSLGADDFVLVNSSPAYYSTGPILSITKTDNVNHVTTSGAPFDWTITAGVSSLSPYPEPGPPNTGPIEESSFVSSRDQSPFKITVTDPLPAGVAPNGKATGTRTGWVCTSTGDSSTGYVEKCTYTISKSSDGRGPGDTWPPITVPVVGVGAPGTQFVNTATVSSTDATPQSASDTVTVVAPITTPATVVTPGLSLTKVEASGSPDPITKAGQTITYDFNVTNTGNTTLNNLAITDTQSVSGEALTAPVSCPVTSLAAGASVTCTGTYTVTSTDITNGKVTDSATATATTTTGTSVTSNSSTLTIPVAVPTSAPSSVTPTTKTTTTKTVTPTTKSTSTPAPVKLITGPPTPPTTSTSDLPLGLAIAGIGLGGLGYVIIERKRHNGHNHEVA